MGGSLGVGWVSISCYWSVVTFLASLLVGGQKSNKGDGRYFPYNINPLLIKGDISYTTDIRYFSCDIRPLLVNVRTTQSDKIQCFFLYFNLYKVRCTGMTVVIRLETCAPFDPFDQSDDETPPDQSKGNGNDMIFEFMAI